MSTKSKFRIGIIGAGIGGLSLSAGLGRLAKEKEVEIHIYEAAPSITEIGAGINIWPRTWDVLKSLGLESGFLKFLPRSLDNATGLFFQVRKSDCAEGIHIEDLMMKGSALRFHRAQLQQALFSQMSGTLHLSHRLVSYEERGEKVILEFANGRRATCDLLIGMDGINSTVRKLYLSKQGMKGSDSSIPIWSGDTAYRALIPTEKLQAEFPGHRTTKIPVMYVGKTKHVIVYPVSHEKFINCVFFTKDISKEGTHYSGAISSLCTQDELWSHFRDWDEEVRALIKCSEKPTKWIIRALNPLDHYATGRVILAGDAAHAMTPHQGMGAGQAIEDAYVLASLIADDLCVKDTLTKIGEIYNAVRVPVANATLEKSRLSGNLVQLLGPGFEDIREGSANVSMEKLLRLTSDFKKMLEWTWVESADADRARALQMFRSSVEQEKL